MCIYIYIYTHICLLISVLQAASSLLAFSAQLLPRLDSALAPEGKIKNCLDKAKNWNLK